MILVLDYRIEKKFSGGYFRNRMRSLVKCECCNKEREAYKEHLLKEHGIKFCFRCFQKQDSTKKKMRERKTGSNHWIWIEDRKIKKGRDKCRKRCRDFLKRCLQTKKTDKTYNILKYNAEDLRRHIESTWESWMNWDNYGSINKYKRTWNIDHIKPIQAFLNENVSDLSIINNLSNLRALDSRLNTSKNSRF